MKNKLKKTIKFAVGTCAAVSVVTLGAVAASGTAVKIAAEGLKAGVSTMKKTVAELCTEYGTEADTEVQEASGALEDTTHDSVIKA